VDEPTILSQNNNQVDDLTLNNLVAHDQIINNPVDRELLPKNK